MSAIERNFRKLNAQAEDIAFILMEEGLFSNDASAEQKTFLSSLRHYAECVDQYPEHVTYLRKSVSRLTIVLGKAVETDGNKITITIEVASIHFVKSNLPDVYVENSRQFHNEIETKLRLAVGLPVQEDGLI